MPTAKISGVRIIRSTVKTPAAVPCGRRQRRSLYLHLLFARTPTAPGAGQEEPEAMIFSVKIQPAQLPGTGKALYREILLHRVLHLGMQPAITGYGYLLISVFRVGHRG